MALGTLDQLASQAAPPRGAQVSCEGGLCGEAGRKVPRLAWLAAQCFDYSSRASLPEVLPSHNETTQTLDHQNQKLSRFLGAGLEGVLGAGSHQPVGKHAALISEASVGRVSVGANTGGVAGGPTRTLRFVTKGDHLPSWGQAPGSAAGGPTRTPGVWPLGDHLPSLGAGSRQQGSVCLPIPAFSAPGIVPGRGVTPSTSVE